jgi:hypothetical protein
MANDTHQPCDLPFSKRILHERIGGVFEKEVPTSKRGKMTGLHDMHWVGPWRELPAGVMFLGSVPLSPFDVLH